MLLIALMNFPMFFSDDLLFTSIFSAVTVIFCFASFTVNTCITGQTTKDICALYWMLDTIEASKFSAIVGLIGMLAILMPPFAYIVIISGIYCVDVFLLGSNFRIILAYCEYKKWQIIVCKLILGLCCLVYMGLGAYFIRNNF